MSSRVRSVILLSGGLDSAANLAWCVEHDEPVLTLTVDYGQRASRPEQGAAYRLAQYYGVRHEIIDLTWLGRLGGSALTDPARVMPALETSELDRMSVISESARAVWVPNRNGILINVAAAYAESLGASRVVVGFNLEEAMTFPDNSSEFLQATSRALSYSTSREKPVQIHCYTDRMDKREIVRSLMDFKTKPFPFPYSGIFLSF